MTKKKTEDNLNQVNDSLSETKSKKSAKPIFKSDADQPEIIADFPEPVTQDIEEIPEEDPHPVKKKRRGMWILLGIVGMLIIGAIGSGTGYLMAVELRKNAELNERLTLAATQFELALNDEKNENYNAARQRLEYILQIYPEYPGLDEKLKDVMLAIALNQGSTQLSTPAPGETIEPVSTPLPTTNSKNLSVLFNQAKAQLAASDWPGLLATVLSLRDIDPSYESVKVDGMYYYALRYNGISKVKQGSLEVGVYYFSLAEEMAPIDTEAESYRIWARMYNNAASNWNINMLAAATQFSELYALVPNLIDASGITVKSRYAGALEGYGDYLQQTLAWCDAVVQYETSATIVWSDRMVEKLATARELCANPPPTPTPTMGPPTPTPLPTNTPGPG
jgi:tetratricopeptide (TPR) repeat protein